jgi:aminoglycoside phosphotransferase (APT) family kinase protein
LQSAHISGLQRLVSSLRYSLTAIGRGRRSGRDRAASAPIFFSDIVIADGRELEDELLRQGLSPDEVILKHCWPRYAPPPESGIRSIAKSENLLLQFERLVAMHRVTPSSVPMPTAIVKSSEGEFVGYILEHVDGDTLGSLLASGRSAEALRQLELVEKALEKLHAKSLAHGDVNTSNIIVADDGRTLLIDPVASPGPGARLQDALCLEQIRRQIDGLSPDGDAVPVR